MKLPLWFLRLIGLEAVLAPWPDTPFTTSGRDMISASGLKVVYAGVNWPGAAETMLPEGLQYNSIENIASLIKSLGANVVRLTYAIEMIDDHYANSSNQTLQATLAKALGETNGTSVLAQILKNNPQFTAQTTRMEVFDAVAAGLAAQRIWVHLDNHISKAMWCCASTDGNSWFGDTYFDVARWTRGLGFMANRSTSWEGLASMSLRNELRNASQPDSPEQPYTWATWLENVIPAADAIHGNNSSPLIFFSGQNHDADDTFFIGDSQQQQTMEAPANVSVHNSTKPSFTPSTYPFADKIVYEIHDYFNAATDCDQIAPALYANAYCAMNLSDDSCRLHAPVVMSEFGFDMTDGSSEGVYAQCIRSTLLGQPGGPGGWMQWTLSGSYYIKYRTLDVDDTWGLLNHNWSAWRNQTVIDTYVKPFIRGSTLQSAGDPTDIGVPWLSWVQRKR